VTDEIKTPETENPEETKPEPTAEEKAAEAKETANASAEDSETNESAKEEAKKSEPTANEKIAQMKDQWLRTMAEFDNFRKRTQKEKEQAFGRGVAYAAEAILPVVDNLERALAAAKEKDDAFVKGVEMTYQQMMNALKSLGIEPIEALGQSFDPHFHHAMMHIDDDQYGENEIVEVLQAGYMYNDTVLRCSMVKVAN
jgi:molecular chaperone GrpE